MLRVRGLIHPTSAVCATTDTARGEKRLPSEQNQAILQSSGGPLGECRIGTVRVLIACGSCGAVSGMDVWPGQLQTCGALFLRLLLLRRVIIPAAPTLPVSDLARDNLHHP